MLVCYFIIIYKEKRKLKKKMWHTYANICHAIASMY